VRHSPMQSTSLTCKRKRRTTVAATGVCLGSRFAATSEDMARVRSPCPGPRRWGRRIAVGMDLGGGSASHALERRSIRNSRNAGCLCPWYAPASWRSRRAHTQRNRPLTTGPVITRRRDTMENGYGIGVTDALLTRPAPRDSPSGYAGAHPHPAHRLSPACRQRLRQVVG
jgi:hypothetical protein